MNAPEVMGAGRSGAIRHFYRDLRDAVAEVPGQAETADRIALELCSQFAVPDRTRPVVLLLHGPEDGCVERVVGVIHRVLEQGLGYAVTEVDGASLRESLEAGLLDGTPTMWSGSRPGIVTSALHARPRSVISLYRIDMALPRPMASLRDALCLGTMHDNHGLESSDGGEVVSDVFTHEAVFIFTASAGAQAWTRPDLADLLRDPEQAAQTMRDALRKLQREYRGHTIDVFDSVVLSCIERHMVLVRPLDWETMLTEAEKSLEFARHELQERFDLPIIIPAEYRRDLAIAHLLSFGADAALACTTPESIEQGALGSLQAALLQSEDTMTGATVQMSSAAVNALRHMLSTLGPAPLRMLGRKSEVLRMETSWTLQGTAEGCLVVSNVRLQAAHRIQDYSGAIRLTPRVPDVRMKDVAGHGNAKALLLEALHLLREPGRAKALGIDLPKGVLLYGPPGTGKTLLARACAGEAHLPCLAVTGTDLTHQARLERVFELARANAPCVLFVDEADSLGARGTSSAMDAVVNQMLANIDGFHGGAPIFYILATNRPEALDPALIRSGRIDRHFYIGHLDRESRRPLVQALAGLCKQGAASMDRLLDLSAGMSGGELAQARRDAALRALRARRDKLSLAELIEELQAVRFGPLAPPHVEAGLRERLATHEAGHAIVQFMLLPTIPIVQISIAPRQGGHTACVALPRDTSLSNPTRAEIRARLTVYMAGREAEIVRYGAEAGLSEGARSDLADATQLAWHAVSRLGMDEEFGALSLAGFARPEEVPAGVTHAAFLRVRAWLASAQVEARQLLTVHTEALVRVTRRLVQVEIMDGADFAALMTSEASIQGGGITPAPVHLESAAPARAPAGIVTAG